MVLLCIMDGFGLRDDLPDNAVAAADKPNFDKLIATCPHTKIDGSGLAVGLPDGQMGNSEVGHLNLGAGRVVYQDISRIDKAIETGEFYNNPALLESMQKIATSDSALHLFGLISDGKVHSSLEHLYAIVELAHQQNVKKLFLHAFMDGRDALPRDGIRYMTEVLEKFDKIGLGKVATVGGRYFGMDRDCRWERINKAFDCIVKGEGDRFSDPLEAIQHSYGDNVTDEFILPTVIDTGDADSGQVTDGDSCLMFNFRSDRMRQLAFMLSGREYKGHAPEYHPKVNLITMTNYDVNLNNAQVLFKPVAINKILGEVLSRAGKNQLRTAETEKYAHVTFFFNGGVDQPFENETRHLIPSPKVATYDLKPEMSSVELTDFAVEQIESGKYEFILLNYANCDMVGHTGDFDAAKKAVEAVDLGLGRLLDAVRKVNGVALVTADHGNAETMIDPASGGPWTAHTTNLVPFVTFDPSGKLGRINLSSGGVLADVAPTVLDILEIKIPPEMTGHSLITRG